MADDEKSKNQILQALDALSHTLYQARAARRTTSLALPRSADGDSSDDAAGVDVVPPEPRPLSRRLSLMSPFRSRSKVEKHGKDDDEDDDDDNGDAALVKRQSFAAVTPEAAAADEEKKGIWGWKPMRSLSHIGMHRVGCLFSLEVVAAQGLPPSMNGLRLAVAVRRKETRDGALQTMPSRVQKGAADFDETLYVRCHLYCSGGGSTGKPLKFEPRPFLLSAVAVDALELDFGQNAVDFSVFVKEFTEKCQQGECPRQWDLTFPLAGKAKGGDLVLKLTFQIMEDGGLGLVNSQPDGADKTTNSSSSSSFARKLSKSSFSIMSPKMLRSKLSFSPKMGVSTLDLKDIDSFKLDEPTPAAEVKAAQQQKRERKPEEVVKVEQQKETTAQREPEAVVVKEEEQKEPEREPEVAKEEEKKEPENEPVPEEDKEEQPKEPEPEDVKSDDLELPEFEVVDKGIEGQEEMAEAAEKALEATMLGAVSDAAAKSVELPETNVEEVAGESLPLPEQAGDDKAAAAKSPPPLIGWRTIAMIVTPIAVVVSKTLTSAR
ncbi:Protein PLASTID MOVEMENT IMPAIRED 1 [Dichanthelium oligosanthes]|uniref:Protein PLASTID MOVEMENT IMPAIRED 1 n=1 Tax=Dichanthelium oligosanthes TaxID=888268 RepID=A0A1E5W0M8_9POAL|nr:Protein PLASTID MOVEMENT IMPAIRED 1 [Dichanthelium oligosanthes]